MEELLKNAETAAAAPDAGNAAGKAASDMVQLLPGVELPSQVAQIICWTLLVLALLGLLMLVLMPLMLGGIKKAVRELNETTKGLDESMKKVAEWSEYTGSQTESVGQQLERTGKTMDDHAAAGRKRTQAQAAQAVQLGKLMQQQIEAIDRNG
jgi:predicted PurR-regulated permease PerM